MQLTAIAPDSRSGLIMGDSISGFVSCHEGRGAGKKTTPGDRERMLVLKEIAGQKICTAEGLSFNRWLRSGMLMRRREQGPWNLPYSVVSVK